MTEAPRQPKPVTVTVEGEDPRDVQMWLKSLERYTPVAYLDKQFLEYNFETTRLYPSSFVIQPKVR